MIGKNARIAAMMILDVVPNPNQITNSGMNATFGTTCRATIAGCSARSSQTMRPRIAPAAMPTNSAIAKPTSTS
jgi:hypothetical protein